jgi:hypothetical protein
MKVTTSKLNKKMNRWLSKYSIKKLPWRKKYAFGTKEADGYIDVLLGEKEVLDSCN